MIQPTPVKTQSGNLSPVLQRGSSSSSRWEEYSRAATGDRVALALVSTSTSLPDDQDGHPRPLPTLPDLSSLVDNRPTTWTRPSTHQTCVGRCPKTGHRMSLRNSHPPRATFSTSPQFAILACHLAIYLPKYKIWYEMVFTNYHTHTHTHAHDL